ncbi:MAG: molybdenum cofactor guanylyltransferase [Micromonosporaceae bacterium]
MGVSSGEPFAAVVLAGGRARRMGGVAKPARTVGGVPLLARVLAAVPGADPRVVVGPADLAALVPPGVRLTIETPPGAGPVAATAAGLAALGRHPPAGTVAVLAADLPFLSAAVLDALRRALHADHTRDGAIVVDAAGRVQWLCGVWRTAALQARLAVLGGGADQAALAGLSMRQLLTDLAAVQVPPPATAPAWFDCDTEEDLRQAEELARGDVG